MLTETKLYDLLAEISEDDTIPFGLQTTVTESDIKAWYANVDIQKMREGIDGQIDRTPITDIHRIAGVNNNDLTVADVIESRGDDPADFDAAYVIRSDRTIVQYFKPHTDGKVPISTENVVSVMENHVSQVVTHAVNAELIRRSQAEFGE